MTVYQTFCFSNLHRPPSFFIAKLPQRLALIRRIHLHYIHLPYHDDLSLCPHPESDLFRDKPLRRCPPCNFCRWLECIKKFLTGIRSINMTLVFSSRVNVALTPQLWLNAPWVARLLALKQALHVAITVKMETSSPPYEGNYPAIVQYMENFDSFRSNFLEKLDSSRGPLDTVIDIPDT